MKLGQRVYAKRKELKLSQDELAAKAGLKSRSSISKIEAGRPTSQDTINSLANALNVTVPYLMGFDESPEEQAEREASILMDDDLMEFVQEWRKLDKEQQASLIQTAKMMNKH